MFEYKTVSVILSSTKPIKPGVYSWSNIDDVTNEYAFQGYKVINIEYMRIDGDLTALITFEKEKNNNQS